MADSLTLPAAPVFTRNQKSEARGQSYSGIETATPLRVEEARPILRIGQTDNSRLRWLSKGKPGSLQTAAEMAALVRKAAVHDEGLHKFAAQILINNRLDSHSDPNDVIDALFRYCQQLKYIHDPAGSFDSIQTARQTIKNGFGDCDDLSVLLATLLALVGFRPRFVLARYRDDSAGYDHIYLDTIGARNERVALDPSTRTQGIGWESPKAIERIAYPIFSGELNSLSDNPQTNQTISSLIAAIGGLMHRGAGNKTFTDARDANKNQILAQMDQVKTMVQNCELTHAEGAQAAAQLVAEYYRWCDTALPSSIADSCRNFERQDAPGQPQYGAFKYRTAAIASAAPACNGTVDAGTGVPLTTPVASTFGGLSASTVYLLGGSALLLLFLMTRQ